MTTRAKIIKALRGICAFGEVQVTIATIAERAGVSTRTVIRALPELERDGFIARVGGQGKIATVTCDNARNLRDLSQVGVFNRVYEDPADRTPGAEYTPVSDIDAARADRARLMANTSWRTRPDWSRRGQDANQ